MLLTPINKNRSVNLETLNELYDSILSAKKKRTTLENDYAIWKSNNKSNPFFNVFETTMQIKSYDNAISRLEERFNKVLESLKY